MVVGSGAASGILVGNSSRVGSLCSVASGTELVTDAGVGCILAVVSTWLVSLFPCQLDAGAESI